MRLLTRTRGPALSDRLTWQAASLLLAYPDEQRTARLDTVEELLSHVGGVRGETVARDRGDAAGQRFDPGRNRLRRDVRPAASLARCT